MSAPERSNVPMMAKHDFLLRRLHSLTGVLPIGLFLIAHLTTNSSVLWGQFALRGEKPPVDGMGGAYYFQKEVTWINEQIPHLLLIEIALWLSIAFHSIYGFYIVSTGKSNVNRYRYGSNWRYWLQRVSGYIGVLYIFYHVATLRWGWTFLIPGGTAWSHHYASSTMALALRGAADSITGIGVLVSLFYLLGVSMLVFHFANGLWTWAITWGLTISKSAQQRWGYVCAGLGAGLMVMAWASVLGFLFLDVNKAKQLEEKKLSERESVVQTGSAAQVPVVTPARTP